MLFEPKSILNGTTIYLKKINASFEEAKKLFTLIDTNRKHLNSWIYLYGTTPFSSPENIFKFLLTLQQEWQQQDSFNYGIYLTNETLIGMISAEICPPQNAGIKFKFWIDKEYARTGKISEALTLLEKEFFFLGIERLSICCETDNYKTRNLALKSGYKCEGIARHGYWNLQSKNFGDLAIYSKIKGEYD